MYKNRRMSKGETIHKMFNNLPNLLKIGLNYAELCIFSKYLIIKYVFDILSKLRQFREIDLR